VVGGQASGPDARAGWIKDGGDFTAAHLSSAPRRLWGRSSGFQGACISRCVRQPCGLAWTRVSPASSRACALAGTLMRSSNAATDAEQAPWWSRRNGCRRTRSSMSTATSTCPVPENSRP